MRADQVPELMLGQYFQLGKELLEGINVDVFARKFVVAPVQGNAVIPDDPSNINLAMEVDILFRLVQFELECFHGSISAIRAWQVDQQWQSYLHLFRHE